MSPAYYKYIFSLILVNYFFFIPANLSKEVLNVYSFIKLVSTSCIVRLLCAVLCLKKACNSSGKLHVTVRTRLDIESYPDICKKILCVCKKVSSHYGKVQNVQQGYCNYYSNKYERSTQHQRHKEQ